MPTTSDRPARLRFGIVGLGRVGAALAIALQRAGHSVVAVSGATEPTRRRAARVLPDVDVLPAEDVARRADAVLLTVPDDALQGVVETLAAQGAFRPGGGHRRHVAVEGGQVDQERRCRQVMHVHVPAVGFEPTLPGS
jgi:predicted short-subunit dehydrogenase-like oxidoreductase (DUF2520 family)